MRKQLFISFFFFVIFLLSFSQISAQSQPLFVPTFESIGIYWSPADGSTSNKCQVEYRIPGGYWRQGYPLWYDTRSLIVAGQSHPAEYRGSLVNLQSGTSYEIRLTLDSGTTVTGTTSTWSEDFPVAETIYIGNQNSTLRIDRSGTSYGYLVYDGQGASIDVNKNNDHNIIINGSYIIVRNFILKNARRDAIEVGESNQNINHVVIEKNEISQWGSQGDYGCDLLSSAIRTGNNDGYFSQNFNIKKIIIQRNKIYNPSLDSTHWDEDPSHAHPCGPEGIALFNSGGNHVIRYNEIYSTNGNYYMDILGAGSNRSFEGFPTSDTDIYGNYLSHAWDDAIESEGGNMNVRIWGNYITDTFIKIAIASTSSGPLYIWRNISNTAQKYPVQTDNEHGSLIKAGGDGDYYGGQIYVFHNTLLQPEPDPGSGLDYPLGCSGGIRSSGGFMTNLYSRNNNLHIFKSSWTSISDSSSTPNPDYNDFDYDLYNGTVTHTISSGNIVSGEVNGIKGVPTYQNSNDLSVDKKGDFSLSPTSLGYDDGIVIYNFNDGYIGSKPDMGAHEAGSPPMEFGVNAYLGGIPSSPNPSISPSPGTIPSPSPSNLPSPSASPISGEYTIYEAENASLSNASVNTEHAGFTGTGFVNFDAVAGASITWNNINVPSTDTYVLSFRYALGTNETRTLQLSVNGVVQPSQLIPQYTTLWTNWTEMQTTVSLNSGTNTIQIATTPTDSPDGPNIDHLKVYTSPKCFSSTNTTIGPDDVLVFFTNFLTTNVNIDINSDNKINAFELGYLIKNWGKSCSY